MNTDKFDEEVIIDGIVYVVHPKVAEHITYLEKT